MPLTFAHKDVQDELKKHMPEFGSAKNPVDLTGMAGKDWYTESVRFAIDHPWVDGLVVLYCETAMTVPLDIVKGVKQAVDEAKSKNKPVAVSVIGGEESDKAISWLVENGIPAYASPEIAINAIVALREQAKLKASLQEKEVAPAKYDRKLALDVIANARADGRDSLTEH